MEEKDLMQEKPAPKKPRTRKPMKVDTKASAGLMMYIQGADLKTIAEAFDKPVAVIEEWYSKYKWASVSRQILKDKLEANKAPETPTGEKQSTPMVVDAFGKGLSVEVANNRREIYVRAGRYHEVIDTIREEMMQNPKKRNAVALNALVKAEQVVAQVRSQALGDYHEVPTTNLQHALAPITVIFPPIVSAPRSERVIEAQVTEVTSEQVKRDPINVKQDPINLSNKKSLIPGVNV